MAGVGISGIRKSKWLQPGLLLVFVSVLLIAIVRIRLIDFPLERDEGEYAMMGQLILEGETPYGAAFNMKYPGVYYMYALFMFIFGESVAGIRTGFLILSILTVFAMWRAGSRLLGPVAGAVSASVFGLMSVSPNFLGFSAHATQFVVMPVIASLWIMNSGIGSDWKKWSLAGLLLGIAVLMKQHAVVFSLAGIVAAWVPDHPAFRMRLRRIAFLTIGIAAPVGAAMLYIYSKGVFNNFWFWTFEYAALYATGKSVLSGWMIFESAFANVTGIWLGVWILAGMGILISLVSRKSRKKQGTVLFAFGLCGFLSVVPSMNFFAHHFVTMIPALALGIGFLAGHLSNPEKPVRNAAIISVAAVLIIGIWLSEGKKYFVTHPEQLSLDVYGNSSPISFVTARQIGKYIGEISDPEKSLLIIGAEPEICFYSNRRPANPFIYVYGLMEVHTLSEKMQTDWIRYAEESDHEFAIIFPTFSWSPRWNSNLKIVKWTESARKRYYPFAWVIRDEIGGTRWIRAEKALTYQPADYNFILILKKI